MDYDRKNLRLVKLCWRQAARQGRFLLGLMWLLAWPAVANPKWELIKEENGIRIYSDASGATGFKSIKAMAVFEGSPEKFMAVLLDIGNLPQWVYGARQARLLKKVNSREILYYVETDLPWPATDRDAVIRMRLKENPATNLVTVISVGEPGALPDQPKMVRVPHFAARWEVRPVDKDRISITYLLDINPGGDLPLWVMNLFLSKGPLETFSKLSGLLKK